MDLKWQPPALPVPPMQQSLTGRVHPAGTPACSASQSQPGIPLPWESDPALGARSCCGGWLHRIWAPPLADAHLVSSSWLLFVSKRGKNPFRYGDSNEALRETSCWMLHLQDVFPAWDRNIFYLPSLAKRSYFEDCSCLWQPKHKAGQEPFLQNKPLATPFQLQGRMAASSHSPVSGIKK